MTKEQLKKEVELELQWLKYYAFREDRENYDPSKLPYEQLRSIGYTKRVIPLQLRCGFCRVTSAELITKDTNIEDLVLSNDPRVIDKNIYTALDFWTIKFPEDHKWIKQTLQ